MTHLNRIIVSVSDLGASLAFYSGLLGIEVISSQAGFATLAIGDGVQLGLHERPAEPSDLAVAASFAVADLDRICAAWQEVGTIVDPPADQPWGERMAVVRDADGHLVCLVELPEQTPTDTRTHPETGEPA